MAKKKRRGLGLVVMKKGKLTDIPVKAKTVVRLREGSGGKVGTRKAIVMGTVTGAKSAAYSRAYGKQVYVCMIVSGHGPYIMVRGAADVYPVGAAKKMPASCTSELRRFKIRN